jgi:hypothetical protein
LNTFERMLGDLVKVRYPRRWNLKLASLPAQKLDWSQSILDGNYLRITVEILLRTCSQSTRRIRSRTQKLLLISSPTQFAMFQWQELTLSLNRVIAIEFPNCDPAFSELRKRVSLLSRKLGDIIIRTLLNLRNKKNLSGIL